MTLADFGLLSALSTRLTRLIAAGEVREAVQLFRMGVFIVGSLVVFILVTVIIFIGLTSLQFAPFDQVQTKFIVIQYTCYSLLFIVSSALEAAMRASNAYADAWIRLAALRILDFAAGVTFLYLTRSVALAVSGMLVCRLTGVFFLYRTTRRRAPWTSFLPLRPTSSGMRGMLQPTIGSAALPLGNAVLNQGVVLAVHASLGANAVALYSTTRTMVSTVRQLSNVVSNGIMPHMTQQYALGLERQADRFLRRVVLASSVVFCAASIALLLGGQWIISVWTLGAIAPSHAFLALMILQVLLDSLWVLIAVKLLSQNCHFEYSVFYASVALITVLVLYFSSPFSIETFPVVTSLQSLALLVFVSIQSRKSRSYDV
ncbi:MULTISPECIES: hypothetical protein [unclassified Arthrobacter]|uniref:hypothetical protein n=1 Tax=unclassified Arthrobacter TaxID=235627 RepID=UPI001C863E20|nr:hypothetical protein [Arthrobacter sp. MAHUQ-56]MBX7444920.1 hypothetical protein [Arthrobacter sp. MAHUQ-56]